MGTLHVLHSTMSWGRGAARAGAEPSLELDDGGWWELPHALSGIRIRAVQAVMKPSTRKNISFFPNTKPLLQPSVAADSCIS